MQTVFSTRELHPRDRFDCWHEVACRMVVPHDSTPECRLKFRAELAFGRIGNLDVICFENSPMRVERTLHHLASIAPDHLYVCRQISGRAIAEQDGRELTLQPGALTCIDPQLPYRVRFEENSRMLLLKLPRDELQARVGPIRDVLARVVLPARAEDRLTAMFLDQLPALVGALPPVHEGLIATQAIDLLALSLTQAARPVRMGSGKSQVLARIHAVIEARLRSEVNAASIARAAGVSVRHANKLLAGQGTSLMRLLQQRRLARCRRALEDPRQDHRSISEIALDWGFSDLTHFGRCFRKTYGLLPREVRTERKIASGRTSR